MGNNRNSVIGYISPEGIKCRLTETDIGLGSHTLFLDIEEANNRVIGIKLEMNHMLLNVSREFFKNLMGLYDEEDMEEEFERGRHEGYEKGFAAGQSSQLENPRE